MSSNAGHQDWWKRNQQNFAICLILAAVSLALFGSLTRAQFVNYDDPDFVTANPHVQNGFNIPDLKWSFQQLYPYWQPLVWMSYMADSAMYGLNPSGFHRTNLLIHVANTLLLYLVLARMTRQTWPSALVAGLFAWHPLHVETVAWVAERKGVLCSLFWMLTLVAYEKYSRKPSKLSYLWVLLSFILALLSKSMAITLPCVLLLLDFWPLRRYSVPQTALEGSSDRPVFKPVQLLLEKVPLLCLSLGSGIITIIAQQKAGAIYSTAKLDPASRVGHSIVSYVVYLRKTFWPDDLAVFYPHPGHWPVLIVLAALLLLLGITAVTVKGLRRFPYLAVGWFIFIGTLLPVIGLFQTGEQGMADRYSYLPLIGIFVMGAWGIKDLFTKIEFKELYSGLISVFALGSCIFATAAQLQYWRSSRALFAHTCAVTESNYLGEMVYGNILFDDREYQEAVNHFTAALSSRPNYADAHFGMAKCMVVINDFPKALDYYNKAIHFKSDYGEAYLGLAAILFKLGQVEQATSAYHNAVKYGALSENLYYYVATEFINRGNFPEAIQALEHTIRIKPNSPDALNRLAWLLATNPDPAIRKGQEALRLANRSCEISHFQEPQALNSLAAAQAEVGQYTEALETAGKALTICRTTGQTGLVPIIEQLQQLYSQKQPYREKPAQNL